MWNFLQHFLETQSWLSRNAVELINAKGSGMKRKQQIIYIFFISKSVIQNKTMLNSERPCAIKSPDCRALQFSREKEWHLICYLLMRSAWIFSLHSSEKTFHNAWISPKTLVTCQEVFVFFILKLPKTASLKVTRSLLSAKSKVKRSHGSTFHEIHK